MGASESFWPDTRDKWVSEGNVGADEALDEHFDFDLTYRFGRKLDLTADLDYGLQIVEETDDTVLRRDGRRGIHPAYRPQHFKGS